MLVVYIVLDDAREALFAERPAAWAPAAYRARLDAMRSREARARTMAGLWLLEQGLGRLGHAPDHLDGLGFAAGGRPRFAEGPGFSISHSGQLVACALDEADVVGLDVEQRREGISPRLQQWVAADGDFFDRWCAREATVKASGHVGLARIRAVVVDDAIARLDDRDWHLTWLSLVPGYAACVAGPADSRPATIETTDCSALIKRVRAE
ncbi:4'-phosphopantetheinyl transferase family protein [Salinisphaera hydrothermalis]|uniref:4'-phosphopantetheinyl transferase family protein n=1 Tax=Salinisphaera hydrothermalis TaxID=563188 RepID=UPI00333EED3D